MDVGILAIKLLPLLIVVGSALHVHFRGKVRHKFSRQLTDHSTFTAPYNAFVYLCSAVPNRPILDRRRFPELDALRDHWREIREEAKALYEAGHIKRSESYDDLAFNSFFKRGWKRFYFKWYGDFLPSARKLCPRTVELLEGVPGIHAAMFTLLAPRSRLVKHRDPFAGSLRYHLGLVTPNSDACRIHIDGEPYSWRDGDDIVFDETYIHRAENDTDEPRIILFCDVERPLRYRYATAFNRFVIRHVVRLSQSRNEVGERVGLFNRIFDVLYRIRLPFKALKKRHEHVYYGLKYAALLLLAAGLLLLL